MPNEHVITLKRPVGPKGKEITELRLREPTAGEVLRASRETGRGLALSLLTQVTGADTAVIEALPSRTADKAFAHLMQYVEPVLSEPEGDDEPPEEVTIPLRDTLNAGGTAWISELTLHEPTLSDLIKAEKYDGMQRVLALVALSSGLPRAVVEMIPITDYAKAARYVMGFIQGVPDSGSGSSDA